MRLDQVLLRGFQSYGEEQVVDIDDHVTLLAGRNNVGKSAFLRALQLPVLRQEGVSDHFQITYRWAISAVDLSSIANREALRWLLDAGGDPKFVEATFHATADPDGSADPRALSMVGLMI